MNFKVGDLVRIKTLEELEKEFSFDFKKQYRFKNGKGDVWVQGMRHACNTICVITEILNNYDCQLEEIDGSYNVDLQWNWNYQILAPVESSEKSLLLLISQINKELNN